MSGSVTYQGKPLPGGDIFAILKSDKTLGNGGIIKADGTFSIADAPIGLCGIRIDTRGMKVGDPTRFVEIPLNYADIEKTDLTYEVKPGENTDVKFDLK